jgi:hypothetical protein
MNPLFPKIFQALALLGKSSQKAAVMRGHILITLAQRAQPFIILAQRVMRQTLLFVMLVLFTLIRPALLVPTLRLHAKVDLINNFNKITRNLINKK